MKKWQKLVLVLFNSCIFLFLYFARFSSEEARKDKLFACLLQELRAARNLNRHFCLELHKAKLQLHLIQQQPPVNEHPPGSIAGWYSSLIHEP